MVKFRVYRGLLVTGCWLLVAGSYFSKSKSELKSKAFDVGYWLLVATFQNRRGNWRSKGFDVGCWLLVTDYMLLNANAEVLII